MTRGQGSGEQISRIGRSRFASAESSVLPTVIGEVEAEEGTEGSQTVVHYHFPVEIEVRAAPEPIDPEAIEEQVLARLAQSLTSLPS